MTLILLTVTTAQASNFALALRWCRRRSAICGAVGRLRGGDRRVLSMRRAGHFAVLHAIAARHGAGQDGRRALCPACAGLPPLRRAHRDLRLMRKMSGVAR